MWAACTTAVFQLTGCSVATAAPRLFAANEPEQKGYWRDPPDIIICPHGPVSLRRVEKAVNFWKELGYTFGTMHVAPRNHIGCATSKVPMHSIMIDIPGQEFDMRRHVGHSRVGRHTKTGEIVKVKIELMARDGDLERILEHEIGHALGWDDTNRPGHIMHKIWQTGGYDTTGLYKK